MRLRLPAVILAIVFCALHTVAQAATFTLTVSKAGTGSGTVTSSPAGIDCGATCSADFDSGIFIVQLAASPAPGSVFAGWSGACNFTGAPCPISMNAAKSVTATFLSLPALVLGSSLNPATLGSPVTFSAQHFPSAGIATGSIAFHDGATVIAGCEAAPLVEGTATCTAQALALGLHDLSAHYGGDANNAPVASNVVVQEIALPIYTLFTGFPTGGSIQLSPTGTNCGLATTCFTSGTVVTLTATPLAGYVFTGWGGECSGTSPTCQLTMDGAKTVFAYFDIPRFTLTVTKPGTGSGTITSSPAGIGCGATCTANTANFNAGTAVTLTATAAAGSTFAGWGGACTGTGDCQVTLDEPKSVTATFTLNTYALSVGVNGSGTVTSAPTGIDCGSVCSATLAHGAVVTLSAQSASGWVFSGWSGGGCTGTGYCIVTMTSATSVSANFALAPPNTHALTVALPGSGSGRVTSSPVGIDCGAACVFSFDAGATVSLAATASADSVFAGWSGACTGTGNCQVKMDAAKSATATFKPRTAIPRLGNISTRGQVLTGNDVMIGGFVIGGSTPKKVLITARGPSLVAYGIANFLGNPRLALFSGQDQVASNDNWETQSDSAGGTAVVSEIRALGTFPNGLAPSSPWEAALMLTLTPGAYTAVVSGADASQGIGIVEVFEQDKPEVPLLNLSTRGQVLIGCAQCPIGDNFMIGGFIIQGDAPQTVLITARGPSLAAYGIANPLANPRLELYSGRTKIFENDNWKTNANRADIEALGIFPNGLAPSNDNEAALLVTLLPGAYTALVSGADGGTGVGIVEVFAR